MRIVPHDHVAGLVLAAGLSTRMGGSKMMVELGGETLVARAARTAVEAGLDPVLVVVGHDAERVKAALAHLPVGTVANPEPARGIHTSLALGVQALPAGARAVVVLLGDMPFVSADMVRLLVERWAASAAPLAISLYGEAEVVAPPILYTAALFPELRALEGDGCGKRVVKRHRAEALELPWPASALADLDEPGDLQRARTLLEPRP